jgi:hypothetical protein
MLEHFSIWYDLEQPCRCTLTDCGLVNLVKGASAAWQRASEGRADRQLRARKRRAGGVLKPKRPTEERCLVPCRVPTNPAPLRPCCAHHRQPDSPMTLGPVGDSFTEPHAAPGLSLSPSLRAACVCPPYALPHASTCCELSMARSLPTAHASRRLHCAACLPARTRGPKGERADECEPTCK